MNLILTIISFLISTNLFAFEGVWTGSGNHILVNGQELSCSILFEITEVKEEIYFDFGILNDPRGYQVFCESEWTSFGSENFVRRENGTLVDMIGNIKGDYSEFMIQFNRLGILDFKFEKFENSMKLSVQHESYRFPRGTSYYEFNLEKINASTNP